jgi:CRP-like cAMP-binding protein
MSDTSLASRTALLKEVEIFSQSNDKVIERIARGLFELKLQSGVGVIRKGEMGNCMYIIAEGRVRVHDGEITFVELGYSDIFGEFSLLDSEPRSASVTTIVPSVLYRLDQETFYEILDEHPEITRNTIRLIVNRLRKLNDKNTAAMRKRQEELTKEVEERTRDLQIKNEELNNAFDEIKAQNEHLAQAYKEIGEKNEEITASIRYARRIQSALLPTQEYVQRHFPEFFTLYRPKDIVSGDFYWFAEKEGKLFFAAVDCTGHGVPGAFMSVLGNSLLNQLVKEHGITQPAEILNQLHARVVDTLKQVDANSVTSDGMDLALCAYDPVPRTLLFAGAQRPLIHFRGREMTEIPGDKFSIGGTGFSRMREPYSQHRIFMQPGDTVYIFSDGYADQFGGDRGRKMQTSRFVSFLGEIVELDMKLQHRMLEEFFDEWRGPLDQLDDVLVFGLRFH